MEMGWCPLVFPVGETRKGVTTDLRFPDPKSQGQPSSRAATTPAGKSKSAVVTLTKDTRTCLFCVYPRKPRLCSIGIALANLGSHIKSLASPCTCVCVCVQMQDPPKPNRGVPQNKLKHGIYPQHNTWWLSFSLEKSNNTSKAGVRSTESLVVVLFPKQKQPQKLGTTPRITVALCLFKASLAMPWLGRRSPWKLKPRPRGRRRRCMRRAQAVELLGVVCLSLFFFFSPFPPEPQLGSPTKIDHRKKLVPYSNLSTGGPRQRRVPSKRTEPWCC